MKDELINIECELRKRESELGQKLIVGSCVAFIILCALPILLGSVFDIVTTDGASHQITISETYVLLLISTTIVLILGLTAGIILIKSSVKNIAKSYFQAPVDNTEEEDESVTD